MSKEEIEFYTVLIIAIVISRIITRKDKKIVEKTKTSQEILEELKEKSSKNQK